jgi:phosphodiesterase/alkaline phosphatase D-like protein
MRKFLLLFVASCLTAFGQSAAPIIGGVWSGNVSPTSATVAVRLVDSATRVRLQVSTNPSLSQPIFSAAVNSSANAGNAVKLTVQGLKPDTDYYYGLEIAGSLRTEENTRGRFTTFPLGRGSFKIAFSSCGDFRHANQAAYDAIREARPLLFINGGDLHYSDTNSTNPEDYRANYDNVLGHRNQGALYRSVPVAYMWDDHDFCGNDADGTAIGRDAARSTYRERVPHYPIGATGGTIAQAFTIGRVRVLMTDLRSASTPTTQRETASKTRMGTTQKTWFKQELINARDAGYPPGTLGEPRSMDRSRIGRF